MNFYCRVRTKVIVSWFLAAYNKLSQEFYQKFKDKIGLLPLQSAIKIISFLLFLNRKNHTAYQR